MKRGLVVLIVLALGTPAAPLTAAAQQPAKAPRIGVLLVGSVESSRSYFEAFRQGLRDLGYVEGKTIVVEPRYAEGKADRYSVLAADLVRTKPDVLVTGGPPAIRAMRDATKTIPIVMAATGDAVGYGFVQSLARPGGNITGMSFLNTELSAKRLELLKEALPKISRVAVLMHTTTEAEALGATEAAARLLRVQLHILKVRGPDEFEGAFAAASKRRAEAMDVLASPVLFAHRKALVNLGAAHRLPAVYQWKEFVEDGGLLSYAPSLTDMYRRAATYVDKILKGAKPADLPVEQPTRFELVINMKTAKALGLKIPQSVLFRADQVIQ